ncbi:MAG: ATP-dependent Clp protease proteolytic subunit [Actinomycetota bacterium]|nr:ATP-dependent Clp protease proteolytic subunit [Actinomycetota bacterium]
MAGVSDNRKWLIGVGVLAVFATLAVGGSLAENGRAQSEGVVLSVELKGGIDQGRRRELERSLEEAKKKRARLVILRLDTPGGEIGTMEKMIRTMGAARMPVVVYVAPDGARAGSAGVFITLASDVAAMAPQTNIGSASPILIGPQGPVEVSRTLRRKILNDTAAYVRALAERHGRNADLAERMVRRATNVTAGRARRERLVDMVAESEAALLKRLDGFRIKGRKARVLRTAGLRIMPFDPSASPDDDADSADGTVAWGLSLPGLIAVAMSAAVIAFLVAQMLRRIPRRR